MHPVVLLILLVAALWGISWYRKSPPERRRKFRNRGLLAALAALLILALVKGQHLFALALAAVPLVMRVIGWLQTAQTLMSIGNRFKSARGPKAGQSSDVRTRYLHMSLDHDSGDLDGEILRGEFRGRRLSALPLAALLSLLDECRRADADSCPLIESYLDRVHGPDWRHETRTQTSDSDMSRSEACEILGLRPEAGEAEVVEAHRRLMQKVHPDRGGSDYLAAKLNKAKEVLLDR